MQTILYVGWCVPFKDLYTRNVVFCFTSLPTILAKLRAYAGEDLEALKAISTGIQPGGFKGVCEFHHVSFIWVKLVKVRLHLINHFPCTLFLIQSPVKFGTKVADTRGS